MPNKITQDIRAAILASFDKVGGVKWLVGLAESHPQAYAALIGRVVPQETALAITHYVAELPATVPTVEAWQQQQHSTVQ